MTENKRITYKVEADKITVVRGEENMELPIDEILEDPDLKQTLAIHGLTEYLRKAAVEVSSEEKMEAIEKAYDRVVSERSDALAPRPRTRRAPTKAEKVAALATLEGATTSAIEQALIGMDKAQQKNVLDSERVTEQLARMERNGEGLKLSA